MTPGSQQPRYIEVAGYEINQDMIDELRGCVIQGNLKRFEANVREIKRHQVTSARSEQEIRETMLEDLTKFIRGNSETIEADDGTLEDAVFCGDLFAWIDRQRRQPPSQQGGREG